MPCVRLGYKLLFLLIFLLAPLWGIAQKDKLVKTPYFKNYSTANGLISKTVYQCVEDSLGQIWFATSRGISMFDGTEFTSDFPINELEGRTVFGFHKDYSGKIWCYTFTGEIGFLEDGNWYGIDANDELIKRYGGKVIGSMFVEQDGSILIGYKDKSIKGLIKIEKQVKIVELGYSEKPSVFYKPFKDKDVWSTPGTALDSSIYFDGNDLKIDVESFKANHLIHISSGNNSFFIADSIIFQPKADSVEVVYKGSKVIHSITFEEEDSLYLISFLKGGLITYKDGVIERYLPNESIYYSFKDKEGGWWICSASNGVYYWHPTKPKTIKLEEKYSNIGYESDSNFYLKNYYNVNEYTIKDSTFLSYQYHSKKRIKSFKKTENFLFYLTEVNELNVYSHDHSFIKKRKDFSFYDLLENDGKIVTGYFGVKGYDIVNFSEIHKSKYSDRVIAIELYNSLIYAGTFNGLYVSEKNELRKIEDIPTLYNKQINKIVSFQNGLVLIDRQSGLLWWNRSEENPKFVNDIVSGKFIKGIDKINDSTLLIISEIGAELVEYSSGRFSSKVVYHIKDGLNFLDAIIIKNELWVLSDKCLFIKDLGDRVNVELPDLTTSSIKVNNVKRNIESIEELNNDEKNIELEFKCFSPAYANLLTYYYKVNGQNWRALNNAKLNLYELAPGKYHIEVKAILNEDVASDTLSLTIVILRPFYLRWWFLLLMVFSVIMISYFWGKYHSGQKQNLLKEKLLRQKAQLNAVQAQINPHFLFNVFNSIQYLVLKEQTKEALQSMSRFSKLMRMALNHSKYEFVPLNHEIRFLLLYVELENLRLDYDVELQFEVDDDVDLKTLMIAPLLLQILIENAMWHGLQSIETDRELILKIQKEGELLNIQIVDNGIGIERSRENKSKFGKQRKSIGTSLIREKLGILENLYNIKGMGLFYKESYPNSENKGTTVELKIMYRESF